MAQFPVMMTPSGDESVSERKRKRSPTPPRRSKKKKLECEACRGRSHKVENCYYLFPEEAPGDFRFNERVKKEVDKRLKTNKKLRQEVEKMKRRKEKEKGSGAH